MPLEIHVIQHIDFETPAYIAEWAKMKKHNLSYTHIYKSGELPNLNGFDILVIMGGPMSINDTDKYDWINHEIDFIKACIEQNKPIIGICLGAQLLAKALGSKIYPGKAPEIGWLPIIIDKTNLHKGFKAVLPDYATPFHWHGDTFDTPAEAIGFANSLCTPNQAFIYRDKVIALQFHLEATPGSVKKMIDELGCEIDEGKYTQPPQFILDETSHYEANNKLMENIMEYLSSKC